MKITRLIRLLLGLALFALGIVLTVNANLGLAPWDAFHVGLTKIFNLSFGRVSMLVGFTVLIINYFLNESIGVGTIGNIFIIGLILDFIFDSNIIPVTDNFITGVIMIVLGMIIIAIASYFYIGSGFGTGPRDGLMVALTRITKKPVGLIRGGIEFSVLVLGFLLGAKIGIGTILIAFGIGPIVQTVFKVLRFEVQNVKHDSFIQRNKGKKILDSNT